MGNRLDEYLSNHFPTFDFFQYYFDRSLYRIRFEVGDDTYEGDDLKIYLQGAYARSIQLFKELHAPTDDLILILINSEYRRTLPNKRKKLNFFQRYLKNRQLLKRLSCRTVAHPDFNPEDSVDADLTLFPCLPIH
ncbi:DUF3885 domain-containing protein [Heliomicrobium gestii]|uniref:DUF3885 domain-containing protein n=1 Tax=Heliomicrobium gestii TaxID=2699 RepID=UPI00147817AA|nr:hypothetical protein [Heliomicrobium gestii]MBM7866906.1 hypothetical protein [Heliomicrobium gestii]